MATSSKTVPAQKGGKPSEGKGGPTTQQRKALGRNLSRVANQKGG